MSLGKASLASCKRTEHRKKNVILLGDQRHLQSLRIKGLYNFNKKSAPEDSQRPFRKIYSATSMHRAKGTVLGSSSD